jgi:hypothetical protein
VRDPSVRRRGCSVGVPFSGFSAALVGGSMLFWFVLSEVDGLLASVDWLIALPPIPGNIHQQRFWDYLTGENASRNWRNSLFSFSRQHNHQN